MYYDHREDSEYAAEMNREVQAAYPEHADEARSLMNKILRREDKQQFLVFNGEAYDHNLDLGELATTHRYVASLLKCRDKGQPVTNWYLEHTIRACLGLGFTVIQGGKTD